MEKHYTLRNILLDLIKNIKKQDFLVYFRKISILEQTDTKLKFGVLSGFMKNNLEAKFYDEILKASKSEIPTLERLEFEIDNNIENPSNQDSVDCAKLFKDSLRKNPQNNKKASVAVGNSIKEKRYSNSRYTLQNFVVGPDSQLAYSACEAVSKKPGKAYNPLYIYGDVGLGKTHLLQATGSEIMIKSKDKKIVYTTADKFISEYVAAVKKRKVENLRSKFKDIDVLIIDDVQFLAKKEQTQNELYNIFNLLYDQNKQIIISGDRAPKELENLEPRLRSRFEWGITVDIGKPDYETRLAILQEKAREREFMIPQDVSEFIAINVTDSVRELEGVLNQLIAEYELTGKIPELSSIAQKLKKLSFTTDILGASKKEEKRKIQIKSYEDIIDAVSSHFGIEKEGILGPNRKKEFMIPRQVAMYLLKTKMNYTFERIGNIFDGRNHAAVLYSCNKLEKLIKKNDTLLNELNVIRDSIGL